jgi:hypothetical protein
MNFFDVYWMISMTVFAVGLADCFFLLMAWASRGGESVLMNVSYALMMAAENATTPDFFNIWIYDRHSWGHMFVMGMIAMIMGAISLGPPVLIMLACYAVKRWFYFRDYRLWLRRRDS